MSRGSLGLSIPVLVNFATCTWEELRDYYRTTLASTPQSFIDEALPNLRDRADFAVLLNNFLSNLQLEHPAEHTALLPLIQAQRVEDRDGPAFEPTAQARNLFGDSPPPQQTENKGKGARAYTPTEDDLLAQAANQEMVSIETQRMQEAARALAVRPTVSRNSSTSNSVPGSANLFNPPVPTTQPPSIGLTSLSRFAAIRNRGQQQNERPDSSPKPGDAEKPDAKRKRDSDTPPPPDRTSR